jgi:hypothetical protein
LSGIRNSLTHRPLAGIGIPYRIDLLALGILEPDFLAVVAELADPVAYDIRDAWELTLERSQISGDYKATAGIKNGIAGESEFNAFGKSPPGNVDQVGARIVNFDPFPRLVFGDIRRRMEHDFTDDDLSGKGGERSEETKADQPRQ